MADVILPNTGMVKPHVGPGGTGNWGDKLNLNWQELDDRFLLTAPADQVVGAGTPGTSDNVARADHVHPLDFSGGTIPPGSIPYDKLDLTGQIVDSDVAPLAAIQRSKLASLTADRALVSDGAGVISPSSVPAADLAQVAGVTSPIQAQIDAVAATANAGAADIAALEAADLVHTADIATNTTNIAALQTSDTTQNGQITALQATDTTHTSQITALQGTDTTHTSQITALQGSDTTQNSQIAALQTGQTTLSAIDRLRVTAQSTPGTTLAVAAGVYTKSNGSATVTYAGGNSPIFAVVTANSRIDLLTIDDSGVVAITQGIQAASPVPATYPTDKIVLAEVTISQTSGPAITQAMIKDVRPYLNLGSGGGGTGAPGYVAYIVGTVSGVYTGSTTVFDLPFTYVADGKNIEVYYNGQQLKFSTDYSETSTSRVTTTSALIAGAAVWFRAPTGTVAAPTTVTLNREDYIVGTAAGSYTGSLTVFDLVSTFSVGGNAMMVTLDGDVQTKGASADYLETDSNTITFNTALVSGQRISFIWSQTAASPPTAVAVFPAGLLMDYAGSTTPTGWLDCDGLAVSRSGYADLFTAIGTTWGVGDGSTTFNLPNLSRRTTVGSGGTGTGTLGNALGNTGGAETHTLTAAETAALTVAITDPGHVHTGTYVFDSATTSGYYRSGVGPIDAYGIAGSILVRAAMPSRVTGITASTNGGGGAHNNMQPSAVVKKIIKT